MTEFSKRMAVTLTIETDVDTEETLASLLRALKFDPARGLLTSVSVTAVEGDDAIVTVVGDSDHRDGVYSSPDVETNFSDTDNPFLQVWLEPDENYEYRLPGAQSWKADAS